MELMFQLNQLIRVRQYQVLIILQIMLEMLMVKFLVNPPNLLLMDEPTTHLDLMSVEALSQALIRYEGTLVFISHDVHFIRALAQKTLYINQGSITPYAGGYDYYLEKSGILDDQNAMDI